MSKFRSHICPPGVRQVVAPILAVLLASLAGCSLGDTEVTPSGPQVTAPTASGPSPVNSTPAQPSSEVEIASPGSPTPGQNTPSGGSETGLTADEAERIGALFARYDARLTDPKLEGGLGQVRLTNVGEGADFYTVIVVPASGGVVTPTTVALEPGASVTLEIQTHLAKVGVEVKSRGREDAPVADIQLGTQTGR